MPHYIRTWKLSDRQKIHLTDSSKIVFRHSVTNSRNHRGVSISSDALPSLKDFANLIERHDTRMKIPLDEKVWIKYDSTVKLYVCSSKRKDVDHRFFRFSDVTWGSFIKEILPSIISFVRDGRHQSDESGESHGGYKSKLKTRSTSNRARHTQQKAMANSEEEAKADDEFVSGATHNVDMENLEEGEIYDCPFLS